MRISAGVYAAVRDPVRARPRGRHPSWAFTAFKWRPHRYTNLTPVNAGRIACPEARFGSDAKHRHDHVSLLKQIAFFFNKLLGY
jgi:hypothetical protein